MENCRKYRKKQKKVEDRKEEENHDHGDQKAITQKMILILQSELFTEDVKQLARVS